MHTRISANLAYAKAVSFEDLRYLALNDLFFLMVYIMQRKDMDNDWCFERCREVYAKPNGYLDLWAREHYKSSIITIGLTIQDILRDPDITVAIFSHTRPIAKSFLRQIKREFESNTLLQELFPHVCPPKGNEKRTWSEEDGLIVKRSSNPKEATIEAWGLVDGQPTGKHFALLVYDDVVTRESVNTAEQIKKTTEAWELSLNLAAGSRGKKSNRKGQAGSEQSNLAVAVEDSTKDIGIAEGGRRRMIGTRYHFNDTWQEILRRGAAKPRIYPATKDGTAEGEPVLLSPEALAIKRRDQGPYTFGCQMLQNPKADSVMGFQLGWFRTTNISSSSAIHPAQTSSPTVVAGETPRSDRNAELANPSVSSLWSMNRYIVVDPAGEKKAYNDYTVMWVIGLGQDRNYYILDGVRDRLNLTERAEALFNLHRKYAPTSVGYEKYGQQADIEHIQDRMHRERYHFNIIPLGGNVAKKDRIRRLVPVFEAGRIWFPYRLFYIDCDGRSRDLTQEFKDDEYLAFPVAAHDDMLDCLARILDTDLGAVFPKINESIVAPQATLVRARTDYDVAAYGI